MRGDFYPLKGDLVVVVKDVKAGSAESIKAGEPVVVDATNAGYVKAAGASIDNTATIVGFALSNSTDTASADGTVSVALVGANSVFRGKAKNKSSLAQAQKGTKVVIDYTSSTYTVDQSTTTNGVALITDFNADTGDVDVQIDLSNIPNA